MKDATMVSYDDPKLVLFASTSSDLVSQTIRKNKIWEQDITSNIIFALSYMNKKNGENVTFVDIGANIGWFSFYVTSSLLPFVHTYSFEAMPRNILFLRNSLCANERLQNSITINGYGLSNQERYCRIFSHERNTQNGVVHCNDIAPESNEMIYRGNVHLLPLDNVFNTPISVIKMDVEGFEPGVLEGAKMLLSKRMVSFLVMEFDPILIRNAGFNVTDLLESLLEYSFKLSLKGFQGPWYTRHEIMYGLAKDILPSNIFLRLDGV